MLILLCCFCWLFADCVGAWAVGWFVIVTVCSGRFVCLLLLDCVLVFLLGCCWCGLFCVCFVFSVLGWFVYFTFLRVLLFDVWLLIVLVRFLYCVLLLSFAGLICCNSVVDSYFCYFKVIDVACLYVTFVWLFDFVCFALWFADLVNLRFKVSLFVLLSVCICVCLLVVLAFNTYFLMLSFVIRVFDSCCVSVVTVGF